MKVIVTGITGLVGSRIDELLNDKYEFEAVSFSGGIDITQKNSVLDYFKSSSAPVVIHLAGKTAVDGCEKDKQEDQRILSLPKDQQASHFQGKDTAWAINVFGTQNIADACKSTNKRLIYVSTDFIFDGEKKDSYIEEDLPNPINWYGRTKYEGENIVKKVSSKNVILRIAYPYRASFSKIDFVRVLIDKLRDGHNLKMVIDNVVTPTFIDDLAPVFDFFVKNNYSGIYHSSGSESLRPFDIAMKICDIFGFNHDLIEKAKAEEFYGGRAKRPSHVAINNDKIKRLGIRMSTLEEGLLELKKQL